MSLRVLWSRRRSAKLALAALAALAGLGLTALAACGSFDGTAAPLTSTPDAEPLVDAADAASDAAPDSSAEDAADATTPRFCPHDASFCVDFEETNVNLGWDDTQHPDTGMLVWSTLGATRPGALEVTVPPFVNTQITEAIHLRRRLAGLAGNTAHLEASVRFEALPATHETAPLRLLLGNAVLYMYLSQASWHVDDGYYGTACGAGPCNGGPHSAFSAPPALHTWDRVTLDVARNTVGLYAVTFTSSSGANITFNLRPEYVPGIGPENQLAVGLPAGSSSMSTRKFLVDDIALTIAP